MNRGKNFNKIYWQYKYCIGIEADPELYAFLKKKYKQKKNIDLIHGAATNYNGTITFNITNNDGQSSSIGILQNNYPANLKVVKSITVPAINLYDYLTKRGITYIYDYISDIQGMDLEVLKTLQSFIDQKKIYRITSEVAKNKYINLYQGLSDNSEQGFQELLNNNYILCGKGWGIIKENQFKEVPEEWWEMDCIWKVKN